MVYTSQIIILKITNCKVSNQHDALYFHFWSGFWIQYYHCLVDLSVTIRLETVVLGWVLARSLLKVSARLIQGIMSQCLLGGGGWEGWMGFDIRVPC